MNVGFKISKGYENNDKTVGVFLLGHSLHIHKHYTVSQKNDNDVLRYNFNAHQPILIIFGRDIAE